MKTESMRRNHRRAAAMAAMAATTVLILLAGAQIGFGQSAVGQPQDLKFELINATTGEPVVADRVAIDLAIARRNNVADFKPTGATFVANGVPITETGAYIITVWYQGVPYWWSKRGRELVGETVTLHVFDVAENQEGISLAGLNLVIRRQESLLRLEYMLQIENATKPQVTVFDSRATFTLALPSGLSSIKATYTRGPEPTEFPVNSPGSRSGLSVPLTPGLNTVRLEAVVPWVDGMEIPVGSNLPLAAWSVLASPQLLEVQSTDLEENSREKVEGYRRYVGAALEAGESISLRLNSGDQVAGSEEDLFTQEAPGDLEADDAEADETKGGGLSLPLIFLGFVVILVIIIAARRRS